MSNAEVMAFAILAAKYFHCNFKMARYICSKIHLFPSILSNSRLNRRIHNIPWYCWQAVFRLLAFVFVQSDKDQTFAASKKRYFCGIKVHLLVTCDGKPIEMHFKPGLSVT